MLNNPGVIVSKFVINFANKHDNKPAKKLGIKTRKESFYTCGIYIELDNNNLGI